MSPFVRRLAAALLMMVAVAAISVAGAPASVANGSIGDADSISAPSRHAGPSDAVAPVAVARLVDHGQPSRTRWRWLAEVLGAVLLAAVTLGRSTRWTVPSLVHRAVSATSLPPAPSRAPPLPA